MIAELLDLARRLEIPTPRPFEKQRVHFLIDLDDEGKLLGITPAYGSTKEKSGEPELGKIMDCPVYFPLKLKSPASPEIQAAGGGGKSVAEAGHGDVKEIFCTQIRTPKGKVPIIEEIEPPAGTQVEVADTEIEPEEEAEEETETDTKPSKNQHYRHSGWLNRIAGYVGDENCKESELAMAIKAFNFARHRVTSPEVLAFFNLPDPDNAAAAVIGNTAKETEDARTKAKSEATKIRNAQLKVIANAKFTFRVNGLILLNDPCFRSWWHRTYTKERAAIVGRLPHGLDGYETEEDESSRRITPVFPHIAGIPNGGMYCPLASFDKAATKSFGLGKHTLSLSLRSSERVTSALKWLLQDSTSHCRLGDKLVAVFWAVPPATQAQIVPLDFASLLNEPDALQVRDFFNNLHGHATATPDTTQFYCAMLSSPKSRITVRSWHTETLGRTTQKAEDYFRAVSLPNVFRAGALTASTMRELADALVLPKGKNGPPTPAYTQILETALFGNLLPHSFLESTLTRQALELAKGKTEDDKGDFESRLRARTALIKLHFKTNRNITMNETTHETGKQPIAYVCGQVLAVLDRIHNEAHRKLTASSPAGRYYGSASSTPALVFPRLCKLARIHLEKIENQRRAKALDHKLAGLISKLSGDASWPRTLSLEQQGQFAIGFYYERAPKAAASEDDSANDEPTSANESESNS